MVWFCHRQISKERLLVDVFLVWFVQGRIGVLFPRFRLNPLTRVAWSSHEVEADIVAKFAKVFRFFSGKEGDVAHARLFDGNLIFLEHDKQCPHVSQGPAIVQRKILFFYTCPGSIIWVHIIVGCFFWNAIPSNPPKNERLEPEKGRLEEEMQVIKLLVRTMQYLIALSESEPKDPEVSKTPTPVSGVPKSSCGVVFWRVWDDFWRWIMVVRLGFFGAKWPYKVGPNQLTQTYGKSTCDCTKTGPSSNLIPAIRSLNGVFSERFECNPIKFNFGPWIR